MTTGPDHPAMYEITAHIDVPPREHASTDIADLARTDRSLRAKLYYLHRDGYETKVRLPGGRVLPGRMFPSSNLMDDDMGYGPKPEFAHLMDLVEGTWVLRNDPEAPADPPVS